MSRKLQKVLQDLEPLAERGKITSFFNNVKDAEKLTGLTDDIRDAMMDYQVRPFTTPPRIVPKVVPRPRCSKPSITRTTSSL